MSKFIIKVLLFFVLIFFIDITIGHVLEYMVNHIDVGGQGRINYICSSSSKDEILIFGSSRAVHHYNSKMMEDSLGMSCYNCGEDGNGIILAYGMLMMNKENNNPKTIIYDVSPEFDFYQNDNHKYLGWLKSYYERTGVPEIFRDVDFTETIKMNSYLYRYNSKFLQNIFVYFTSISSDEGIKGFRPKNMEFDSMKVNPNNIKKKRIQKYDPLKFKYIDKFIELASDCRIIFAASPMWYGMDSKELDPIREICIKRNIEFFDFSNDPTFVHNDYYFYDGIHLNARGADLYTEKIIKQIK